MREGSLTRSGLGGGVKRSDERAFEQFVATSGHSLIRTAFLLTGDVGHAEDLVQTALERTARRWHQLDGSPHAYARVVLTNLAADRWRRRRARVEETPLDEEIGRGDDDEATNRIVLQRSLIGALRQLPMRQRTVLVLRFFEDLSEAETAQVMRISAGTVKSTASRALARLRELCPELNGLDTYREEQRT